MKRHKKRRLTFPCTLSNRKETYVNQLALAYSRNVQIPEPKDTACGRSRNLRHAFFRKECCFPEVPFPQRFVRRDGQKPRHPRSLHRFKKTLLRVGTRRIKCADCGASCHEPISFCPKPYVKYTKKVAHFVRYLSIDEVYLGRTFGYITVVRDLISGSVLYVGKGKGGDALPRKTVFPCVFSSKRSTKNPIPARP